MIGAWTILLALVVLALLMTYPVAIFFLFRKSGHSKLVAFSVTGVFLGSIGLTIAISTLFAENFFLTQFIGIIPFITLPAILLFLAFKKWPVSHVATDIFE